MTLKDRINVEALLQNRHAIIATVNRKAELGHPAKERILVAVEPNAQCFTGEVSRGRNATVFTTSQHHARRRERLRDVNHVQTFFTRRKRGRHPVQNNISTATSDNLCWRNVRATWLDCHVQTFVGIETVVQRNVVTSELRLCYPFKLQRHIVRRLCCKTTEHHCRG